MCTKLKINTKNAHISVLQTRKNMLFVHGNLQSERDVSFYSTGSMSATKCHKCITYMSLKKITFIMGGNILEFVSVVFHLEMFLV